MPGDYPVIRPGKPVLKTTFLFNAGVGRLGDAPPDFRAVVATCLRWVQEKHYQELPQLAWNLEPFRVDETNATIFAVALEEENWALRLRQPDTPYKNNRAIAGRSWTTDISVEKLASGEIRFFIRTICSSQEYDNPPIACSRPLILMSLAEEFGLYKDRQLRSEPLILDSFQDLSDLMYYLLDPERRTPVVVLSEINRDDPFHENSPFGLDETELAQRVTGLAHVYCLPWRLAFEWSELVGREWSAYDGSVRCYYPGLSFEDQDPFQHPLTFKSRIRYWQHLQEEGPVAFCRFLTQKLAEETTRRPGEISSATFYSELQQLFALHKAVEKESGDQITGAAASLVEGLRRDLEIWKSMADEYALISDQTLQQCSYFKDEIRKLKACNQTLLERLKGNSATEPSATLPSRYEDVADWVEKEFAGRLQLHPRAKRALKDADYENLPLVIQCLNLLANDYIDMRQGLLSREDFDAALGKLNVGLQRSVTEERAGEFKENYTVEYPSGSGKKEMLEYHLSAGNSREPRHCLRIYFFYDKEMEHVVVGWLPSHLPNRLS